MSPMGRFATKVSDPQADIQAWRPADPKADSRIGRDESRPCKNVLSDGGAEVETKRRTPRAQARIASINGLVPITAITRFIL